MEKNIKSITRRDFLRGTAYVALFGTLELFGKDKIIKGEKTRVIFN